MNAQLTANAPASEPRGIDKLFAQMAGMYGSKFADLWAGVDAEQVKKVWVAGLAGLTGQEIAQGIDACMSRNFPPTLPEFRNLCRPAIDPQAMLYVAIREMRKRRDREVENWPSNRIFWAAQRLGGDLLTVPVEKLTLRWQLAWVEALRDEGKPIPDAQAANALPAPGKTTISDKEASQRLADIGLQLNQTRNERRWAYSIASDPKNYPRCSIEGAIKAFKTWNVELPKDLIERAKAVGLEKLIDDQEAAA